jgi:hypothetical protein
MGRIVCTTVEFWYVFSMPLVLMEKTFPVPASDEIIEMMRQATEACFEINDVERKITYRSEDRLRFVCVMEAADLETARRALESAGMDYDRLYPAVSF